TKDNKATAGADAVFASAGMAVVVKKGAPKPDISTPETFKQALLNAKAIAYFRPRRGRRKWRLLCQIARSHGYRGSGQGQDQASPTERQFGQPRRGGRRRTRDPAGTRGDVRGGHRYGRSAARRSEQHHGLCGRCRRRQPTRRRRNGADPLPAFAG